MVFLAKYRRVVFGGEVEKELKGVCFEIEKRYELNWTDGVI